MIIKVLESDCFHISSLSVYNNNYYYLPFSIDLNDVINIQYDGGENLYEMSIGKIVNNEYVPKLWFIPNDKDDVFTIDLETASETCDY